MSKVFPIDSYLRKQSNGVFQFRLKVPKDIVATVGKPEFTASLKTKDHGTAQRLAYEKLDYYQGLISRAKSGEKFIDLDRWQTETVSNDQFRTVGEFAITVARKSEQYFRQMNSIDRLRFYQNSKSPTFLLTEFEKFLSLNGINLSKANPHFDLHLSNFQKLLHQSLIIEEASQKAAEYRAINTPEQFERKFFKQTDSALDSPMPLISEMYAEYIVTQDKIDADERKRSDNVVQCFIDFIGDIPINYVKKANVKDFMQMVQRYPVYRTEAMDKMKFQDVIAYAESLPNYKALSQATAKVWYARLNRMFNYAVQTYDDQFDIRNPLVGMTKTIKGRESTKKRNFSPDELTTIFTDLLKQKDHKFYIALVCLYTGCRLSEFVDQSITAIGIKNGIRFLDITDGKTEGSIRQVPLPDFIFKAGFGG